MPTQARKLDFHEAIDTCVAFYNSESLEERFDAFIQERLYEITQYQPAEIRGALTAENVADFLKNEPRGLLRILGQLRLSEEKFKRIITLRRKLDYTFDREWSIKQIERRIATDNEFALRIAELFINGHRDPILVRSLPKFYRERLNLSDIAAPGVNLERLKIELKDKYIGTYSNWKGDIVEGLIKAELARVEAAYGLPFSAGTIALVNVTVDWVIPSVADPCVIIMSSYQETTSSGQSTKARDMLQCYQAITQRNAQFLEDRAFVNFVDGGGWLARQKDFRRLVAGCHYFLNIANVDMLESIILQHVPARYLRR